MDFCLFFTFLCEYLFNTEVVKLPVSVRGVVDVFSTTCKGWWDLLVPGTYLTIFLAGGEWFGEGNSAGGFIKSFLKDRTWTGKEFSSNFQLSVRVSRVFVDNEAVRCDSSPVLPGRGSCWLTTWGLLVFVGARGLDCLPSWSYTQRVPMEVLGTLVCLTVTINKISVSVNPRSKVASLFARVRGLVAMMGDSYVVALVGGPNRATLGCHGGFSRRLGLGALSGPLSCVCGERGSVKTPRYLVLALRTRAKLDSPMCMIFSIYLCATEGRTPPVGLTSDHSSTAPSCLFAFCCRRVPFFWTADCDHHSFWVIGVLGPVLLLSDLPVRARGFPAPRGLVGCGVCTVVVRAVPEMFLPWVWLSWCLLAGSVPTDGARGLTESKDLNVGLSIREFRLYLYKCSLGRANMRLYYKLIKPKSCVRKCFESVKCNSKLIVSGKCMVFYFRVVLVCMPCLFFLQGSAFLSGTGCRVRINYESIGGLVSYRIYVYLRCVFLFVTYLIITYQLFRVSSWIPVGKKSVLENLVLLWTVSLRLSFYFLFTYLRAVFAICTYLNVTYLWVFSLWSPFPLVGDVGGPFGPSPGSASGDGWGTVSSWRTRGRLARDVTEAFVCHLLLPRWESL